MNFTKKAYEEITQRISKPLTDADLEKYVGIKATDIIKYSDLKNYKTIDDLLPTDKSFRIILLEETYNSGHWIAIMRYGKTCEIFNSYGYAPDYDWRFINRMMRVVLGEDTNELTRLMKQADEVGYDAIYNKKDFQSHGSNIQTCGRWVVLRIEMMRMGYDLPQFVEFIQELCEKTKQPTDFVVSMLISK